MQLPGFRFQFIFIGLTLIAAATGCASHNTAGVAAATTAPAAPVALEPHDALTIEVKQASPLQEVAAVQVVCVLPYAAGETNSGPAVELLAMIRDRRVNGGFGTRPMETILLDPAPAPAEAKRILFVAAGRREELTLGRVREIGATAVREAARIGVDTVAFAPVLRDQGVTNFSADDVVRAFLGGFADQYETELAFGVAGANKIKLLTYEAGADYIDAVRATAADFVHNFNAPHPGRLTEQPY